MNSAEIRKRFLDFFAKRGHAILPSAPLVPENDPSVLFNTAGMQPLVPYLMGRPHPMGDKLADIQKCVRTTDIEDVGDNRHLTFFEMMGNWSLGSYFKEDAIKWSYQLLTDKKEGFGLDPKRLYVTVFAGDANTPRDDEAAKIWESVGMPKHRIYFKDASANWWPAVKGKDTWTGPTGPCSEMFYDVTEKGLGDMTPEQYNAADDAGQVIEIWNDVFMQFEKKDGTIVAPLTKKNVDTGAGFERICAVLQGKDNVFETDIFVPLMQIAATIASDLRRQRIIADHIRTSTFMIADGVTPSNTDAGYVLRRIIRRMVFAADKRTLDSATLASFMRAMISTYSSVYPNIADKNAFILSTIQEEVTKFVNALGNGIKEFERMTKDDSTGSQVSAQNAFSLYSSYGLPIDLTRELAKEKGMTVDVAGFEEAFKKHQDLSRAGAEQKFKGGLADANDPQVVRYHTATHLLHQALHDVLGEGVGQKGSNITRERLRFDFSFGAKMTDEQKKNVEQIVNEKIAAKLPVNQVTMPRAEAEKTGARHFFGEKYGDQISIYFIGNDLASAYSKEFCGGPHVSNTSELAGPEGKWRFKIQKEEAVSAGVRRIKAVLE
jgi:alanyl-tRNA synthetase